MTEPQEPKQKPQADPAEPPMDQDEENPSLIKEFYWFLTENKKWWLIPLIILFVLLGLALFLGNTALAPFIYSLL